MENKYVNFGNSDCCGCTACYSACPKNAITMSENEKGFKYPVVDESLCINCGICKGVCDFNKREHISCSDSPLAVYGIKHLNENVRNESRSGGVFTAITDVLLERGAVIFGATLDDDFVVRHIKCSSKEERDKLRGSKYVQSDLSDTFKAVEQELKSGRIVAFSGTGCQVAGLKSFLRKDYENLYTFDIVCHGVPSPKVFGDYISYINKKYGKISGFNFRDKTLLGWDMHIESFMVKGKKRISRMYAQLFTTDYISRESCYNCKYTNISRPGDFTLADFWGVDKAFKGFNDNKGVSLLLVNSEKGNDLFEDANVKNVIEFNKCESDVYIQPQLKQPAKKPNGYDTFWQEYEQNGFDYVMKKYSTLNKKIGLNSNKVLIKRFVKRKIFKKI